MCLKPIGCLTLFAEHIPESNVTSLERNQCVKYCVWNMPTLTYYYETESHQYTSTLSVCKCTLAPSAWQVLSPPSFWVQLAPWGKTSRRVSLMLPWWHLWMTQNKPNPYVPPWNSFNSIHIYIITLLLHDYIIFKQNMWLHGRPSGKMSVDLPASWRFSIFNQCKLLTRSLSACSFSRLAFKANNVFLPSKHQQLWHNHPTIHYRRFEPRNSNPFTYHGCNDFWCLAALPVYPLLFDFCPAVQRSTRQSYSSIPLPQDTKIIAKRDISTHLISFPPFNFTTRSNVNKYWLNISNSYFSSFLWNIHVSILANSMTSISYVMCLI